MPQYDQREELYRQQKNAAAAIPEFPPGIGQVEELRNVAHTGNYDLVIPEPGAKVVVKVSAEVRSTRRARFVQNFADPEGFWIFETYLSTGRAWLRLGDNSQWEVYDAPFEAVGGATGTGLGSAAQSVGGAFGHMVPR